MSRADDDLAAALTAGHRAALGRAITLVESHRLAHRDRARALLSALLPRTGGAHRIGLTGPPGAGKSTTIEALGLSLTAQGLKVAVLAIDPSSQATRGSILGDKTRMGALAVDPHAFIRPSPSSGALGGAGAKTRETILLCEAAGYEVVIVETVGVGQSETLVADMTDTFVTLMQPGAGDELQGLKKGLLERADIIAVNKADGALKAAAERTARDHKAALKILSARSDGWVPSVTVLSALTGSGVAELWAAIDQHRRFGDRTGAFEKRRAGQNAQWFDALISEGIGEMITSASELIEERERLRAAVARGEEPARVAAETWLNAFGTRFYGRP
ncbi:MAG: methylmalonyl Co-A mutase-associated GTPase MeaB [Maricaulaceae bacterium]